MDLQEAFDAGFDAVKTYVDGSFAAFEKRMLAMERKLSELPTPKDGKDADPEQVARIIRGDIDILRASVDAIKPAPELPDIPAMIAAAIAPMQKAVADIDKLARAEVLHELADQKIKAADGLAAARERKKAASIALINQMVTEAVMALPPAEKGKDADPALVASLVKGEAERILAGWARPQDGKSVTAEELVPLIEDRVLRAVSAIPAPKDGKDGIGIASAMIDRTGNLIVTATDGTTKELGRVVGADGRDGLSGKDGLPGRDGKGAEPVTKDQIIDVIRSTDAVSVVVQQYLDANPPAAGKDGRDGVDGKDGAPGTNGKDGTNGIDGAPGVNGKDGTDGLNGKDGRDAIDVKDLLVMEGGDLVATFSDGRSKVLGPFRGKDGAAGKDADLEAIGQMIRDAVAKHTPTISEQDEFVPDELAANISLAVKKMAEMPVTVSSGTSPITIYTPEQKAPVFNMAAPVVNVAQPNITIEAKRTKEVTKVTGHDQNGRIASFEKTEIDDD